MEGVWKINPFYWIALRRFSRKQRKQSLAFQQVPRQHSRRVESLHRSFENLNPLRWSHRAIRVFTVGFFSIMMPIYVYLGIQPAASIEVPDTGSLSSLKIDSIDLDTPVETITLQDHQLIAPDYIAGAYNANNNKIFLIGHSSTVFQDLNQLSWGNYINYDGVDYYVTNIMIKAKADIDMNEILAPATQPTLILMTCAGDPLPNQDATHRLIVTAVANNN